MSTVVALFRAVNVGGRGAVPMAELRAMAAALGFTDARTLLNTGNLVFSAGRLGAETIEHRLAAAAAERFGLKTDVLVRTAAEWERLIAANPFAHMASSDPSHLVVMPLAHAPKAGALDALRTRIAGRETVECAARTLYACYPDGIGNSKLTVPIIEKTLGTTATGRNWNTVIKIDALLRASAGGAPRQESRSKCR